MKINNFIQELEKWDFLDSPNKKILLFDLLIIFCVYAWYIGYVLPGGIFIGVNAVVRFFKPQIFPRLRLLSEGDPGGRFNQWYQRIVALILLGISVDAIMLYRIQRMTLLPIFHIFICAVLEIVCILWIVRFSKGQTRTARAFVWICSLLLLALMIYYATECWLLDRIISSYNDRWEHDISIFRFVIPCFLLIIALAVVTRVHPVEKQKEKIGRYLLGHVLLPLAVIIVAWIMLGNYIACSTSCSLTAAM